jgi:hypothetical protein
VIKSKYNVKIPISGGVFTVKKIIAVIMALACIVCVFASCGKKDDTPKELTSGDYTYVVLEDGTIKITKYNGTSDEIERDLPSEIDGKTVTVIGKEAFAGAEGLTVVNFPTGLVKIEERAFAESSIKKAFMYRSKSLKEIGAEAFSKCPNLVQVDMSSSLETVGEKAFFYCTKLKVATFRGNTPNIADFAFDACPSLVIYTKEGMDKVIAYAEKSLIELKYLTV